jgi:hypothetical protein
MSKILIIPDTHGRDFWKPVKQLVNNYDKIIFLGDYVDPYPYEFTLSYDELRIKTLTDFQDIIDFAKNNSNIILLDGNHLLHYVNPTLACSRFDFLLAKDIKMMYEYNKPLFHSYYCVDDILFTHAGISEEWVKDIQSLKQYQTDNIIELLNNCTIEELMMCGPYRGGNSKHSGPEWLDVHEFEWLTPLSEYYQIFGHTQLTNPIITNQYACLDTRQLYVLNTETKQITHA